MKNPAWQRIKGAHGARMPLGEVHVLGGSAESALHRDEPGWWREAVSVKEVSVVHNQRSTGASPDGGGRRSW